MPDTVLLTELYPYVEKAFSDKQNVLSLEKMIGKFIDKNAEKLSAIGPTEMIYHADIDKEPIYKMVGVTESFVKSLKNRSKDIKSDGSTMVYPFNSLMPMIIRYFILSKNNAMLRMCVSYLALSIYPILYFKYFKYGVNENVMNYTINNLSNKYKIKQTGNLFVAIAETADGAYALHTKDLIRGNDKDVVDFVLSLRTRLNSFLKKISNEYYKNHESKKYLNTDMESNDPDNYREADSSVYAINRIVEKTTLKLIVDGPSIKLISIAAKNNQVSVNELRNYINTMLNNDKKEDIKKIIESILYIFVIDLKNDIADINSDKFLIECLDIYKRSNTVDKNVVAIKKILDSWLEELGTYKKTQRLATINNFRRALYTFFVISIEFANIS